MGPIGPSARDLAIAAIVLVIFGALCGVGGWELARWFFNHVAWR